MHISKGVLRVFCAAVGSIVIGSVAQAADPIAEWEGDFSELTQGPLTISLNGNERATDDSALRITSENGILVDHETPGGLNVFTMIMRCSGLNLASSEKQVLFTASSAASGAGLNKVGVNLPANNAVCRGVWQNSDWNDASVVAASVPSDYTTLVYDHRQAGGTFAYAIANGNLTTIFARDGLRASSDTYSGMTIGGLRGTTSDVLKPSAGLTITAIAFFDTTLSAAEIKSYQFPSERPESVAEVDGRTYATLADAVAAGNEIRLLANCGGSVELDKDITLSCTDDIVVSTSFSGSGSIVKSGTGTLTLSGSSTFTGSVTVSEGVLARGGAAAFGPAENVVEVLAGGTLDMNHIGGNANAVKIAGAGAEGHPFALTSTGSLSGFGSITLTADATIGTTTSFSFGDPNAGTTLQLAGFKLSFSCGANGITGTNMNFSDGTVEIASGRYTANRWNNSGAGATLVIREGATYASSVDSDSRCTFLNVENAGVVEMDAAHTLRVTGTYSGSGSVNNLWLGNGATLATLGVSVSNRLVQEGALTVDLSGVEPGETADVLVITGPASTVYKTSQVTVTGAEGQWSVKSAGGALRVAKGHAIASVGEVDYPTAAEAFAAATEGQTVRLHYSTSEAIVVGADVIAEADEGAVYAGAITGTGSLTIPEGTLLTYSGTAAIGVSVRGAGTLVITDVTGTGLPAVAGVTADAWTGAVWLKGMTGKQAIDLANLGHAGSEIRISGLRGWLANAQTIAARVVLSDEGYDYALNIHDGSSGDAYVNTFTSLAGDGRLLADGGSTAGFLVEEWSEFTGSVETVNKTLVFGTQKKSGLNRIVIDEGATVTVAEGARWTSNGGIQVDGTLVVEGTTTYDNFTPQTSAHGTLASRVVGAGEVVYHGALPADVATAMYTNELWTGSVTLRDFGVIDDRTGIANSGHVRACLPGKAEIESWQNENSRITFEGVKAWVPNGAVYNVHLVLRDRTLDGESVVRAWHNDSGGSNNTTTFARLSGSGTFYDDASCSHILKFLDAQDFTGDVDILGKRVCFGASTVSPANGGVYVSSPVATADQTWTAPGGVTFAEGSKLVYRGGVLDLSAQTLAVAGEELPIELGSGESLPTGVHNVKIASWQEKPSDVLFVPNGFPSRWRVSPKRDGLYLSNSFFSITIR